MNVDAFVPFVLNLRRSTARRDGFFRRFRAVADAPFAEPSLLFGIDGRALPKTPRWISRERSGAFGCFVSHLRVWETAFANGFAETGTAALIFEDDATFDANFSRRFRAAVAELPDDFGLFYLGGQHMTTRRPAPTYFSPNLYRAANVNRLHAYAVGPTVLGELISRFWDDFSWGSRDSNTLSGFPEADCDHELGKLTERGIVKAFAIRNPVAEGNDWICGQDAGVSENTGAVVEARRWELKG